MHETHIAFCLHLQKLGETTDYDEIKRKKIKNGNQGLRLWLAISAHRRHFVCQANDQGKGRQEGECRQLPHTLLHSVNTWNTINKWMYLLLIYSYYCYSLTRICLLNPRTRVSHSWPINLVTLSGWTRERTNLSLGGQAFLSKRNLNSYIVYRLFICTSHLPMLY